MFLKLEKPIAAAVAAGNVLKREPKDAKALYRRASAYELAGRPEEAAEDLRALQLRRT